MPFHWVAIPSSPPRERRDDVREICRRHGGRLCENQVYYDEQGAAHTLVELPGDEKHDGKRPPKSGRRGQT